ncbi:hypothetical protein KIN20_007185 [Parelaphostrongylus tenuis]|uniref:Uncharacterized protein n=1 Tax=Parelaphostrongylus tenuis TaxID=148309 RepID=A0AAD5MP67_PARTN|nr:hypothetical protein KIN20_007185 [Parelaphostrongylus tenuis]
MNSFRSSPLESFGGTHIKSESEEPAGQLLDALGSKGSSTGPARFTQRSRERYETMIQLT